MDDVLRRALLETRAVTPCVEADVVAAWVEGGLRPAEAASVEAHVSSCARCQAVMATLIRTTPATTPVPGFGARLRALIDGNLRWLVPTAGVAAALLVYLATRPDTSVPVLESLDSRTTTAESPVPGVRPPTPVSEPAPAPTLEKDVSAQPAPSASSAGTVAPEPASTAEPPIPSGPPAVEALRDRSNAPAPDGPAQSVAAPPPPAAPAVAATAPLARLEAREGVAAAAPPVATVVGPGRGLWRIAAGGVEYSRDGGSTWQETTGVTTVVAGAAVSDATCWMVGPQGAVFVTVDGTRFSRVTFPQAVNLTRVVATDERTATVSTADGRSFTTRDQGASWVQVP